MFKSLVLIVISLDLVRAGIASPVFIQHLPSGAVTFPTNHCNRCRGDKLDVCLSSRVQCKVDGPPEELIWSNVDNCDGPPTRRISSLPSDFVTCPGPEHYSPKNINLDRFNSKLQRDYPDLFPNNKTADMAIKEYRKMLILNQVYPHTPIVPSKLVDQVWHTHILDTIQYHRDCLRMFGRYLHHAPSFGGEEEKTELREDQKVMLEKYQEHFNEAAPVDIWPVLSKKKKLPDCCKAECVKPNCVQCVGCDAINCGYEDDELKTRTPLSPSTFGGYVPIDESDLDYELPPTYAHKVTPFPNMEFSWTISDGYIQYVHTLKDVQAWYAFGVSGKEPHGMAESDYMLSSYNKNYTGVFDLWKYDDGEGYPCWDVLYECSVKNKTKGTKDIEDSAIKRADGITTSTWRRKLNTGDSKDWPIVRGDMTVLFAYGDNSDWFLYHTYENRVMCEINFYDGTTTCGNSVL